MGTLTTEDAFRQALEANSADLTTRLILADWLEEQDPPRSVEARGQRWQVRNRQWPRWCNNTETWDWWEWYGKYLPYEYFNGYLEAILPDDIFALLEAAVVERRLDVDDGFLEYPTLRDAETALAHALASLDL